MVRSRYPNWMDRYRSPAALAAVEQYCRLADTSGITMAQLSLGWCRSRWYCASTIVGATSVEQLQENLAPFREDAGLLPAEVLEAIDEIHLQAQNPSQTVV